MVHTRVRGRRVRIDGRWLMSQIAIGKPMIVTSAIQAIATAIPEAHQPIRSHQMNRTNRFGPLWWMITVWPIERPSGREATRPTAKAVAYECTTRPSRERLGSAPALAIPLRRSAWTGRAIDAVVASARRGERPSTVGPLLERLDPRRLGEIGDEPGHPFRSRGQAGGRSGSIR